MNKYYKLTGGTKHHSYTLSNSLYFPILQTMTNSLGIYYKFCYVVKYADFADQNLESSIKFCLNHEKQKIK